MIGPLFDRLETILLCKAIGGRTEEGTENFRSYGVSISRIEQGVENRGSRPINVF
jgi:hypothetical protein